MRIYTKTGDGGQTGLYGGDRVDKDDPRVEAYGTVDETNASLGMARALGLPASLDRIVQIVQTELFVLGAELACKAGEEHRLKLPLIDEAAITAQERHIDELEQELEPLRNFILPAGVPSAAALHVARTVCRRAERRVRSAARQSALRPLLLVYLNRLSDLLFVLARAANHRANVADVPWQPRARGGA